MTIRTLPGRLAAAVFHPRTTVRWRLTLLYGALFLVSGAALLAITYGLLEHANSTVSSGQIAGGALSQRGRGEARRPPVARGEPPARQVVAARLRDLLRSRAGKKVVRIAGSQQRIADLHQLLIESAIALALMALLSTLLGWLVAGRVLAPLRTMTARTRAISEDNLHRRLALDGPPDELHQLADTIDALLARLEGAFVAQRRFVANASHELRTPLTAVRALLEMVLSDPEADVESFRVTCRQALHESAQQEQLIDALLALARGQRGLDRREPLDLSLVAADVLGSRELEAAARGLWLRSSLTSAPMSGDRPLVARLVANLVDNAIRHNVPGGHLDVLVTVTAGQVVLTVRNSGPQVPADEVDRLLQPFQRLGRERVSAGDEPGGIGLGLSIVAAIVAAHDASLCVRPAPTGGLDVEVRFPGAVASELPLVAPPMPEEDRAALTRAHAPARPH
jgi:signal transduction histidine kinase